MFFDTATELFRLRNDNRQLKKSHWYTQIGLWLAAGGLLVTALFEILNYYRE